MPSAWGEIPRFRAVRGQWLLTVWSCGDRISANFLFSLPRILRELLTAAKRYGFADAWRINGLQRAKLLTFPQFLLTGGGCRRRIGGGRSSRLPPRPPRTCCPRPHGHLLWATYLGKPLPPDRGSK
ncbi:conserved hypothetical protein [Magnetospirillum sp. LM-5]|nr:conserved hypothetical protein [Magnetospirillum sp. LM-5]